MPRPQRCRRICVLPKNDTFNPTNCRNNEPVVLTLDEYEVIRLVYLEEKTHEQCAAQMDISRSTVQEVYESARRKLAACLVYGRKIVISGGNYRICGGKEHESCGSCCRQSFGTSKNVCKTAQKGDHIMKIAVTYDNRNIFQHFGKTETFKVYEVEDNKVVSSEVIGSNGEGHGALAGLLAGQNVDVLICGGIGGGAQTALAEAGVELCSGAQGDADQAVEAYLKGELVSRGATCDHHHHEEGHSCGDHEEGHSCGSSCGGGCGSHTTMEGKNVGKKCRTHYRGTFNDGTQFDSSYDRGEPLEFVCGAGMMIKGFDAAVASMEVGQTIEVHLMPEEAYGQADPDAIFTVELAQLPGAEELEAGQQVYLQNAAGQPFPVKVVSKDDTTITFDANHEMAGKELNFTIELVSVEE